MALDNNNQSKSLSIMSIYIPHVFVNIHPDIISKTFEDLKYGKVKHVDFVDKMDRNGKMYHSVYVHFDYWYDNIACNNFQERVKNPDKEVRIIYKEPWYWICLENTSANINIKHVVKGSSENKIRINLDDLFTCSALSAKKTHTEVSSNKKEIDIEYVKQLELMNYKLMYDLRNIQGDFIMV
jgi:hypothetical protein